MARVRDIDTLIAIVSVIRPGAANNLKKLQFSRRAQRLEPVEYAHPCLEPILRSTFGVVAYEEHILQICEAFAGLSGGRADILRRALVKIDLRKIDEIGLEFVRSAIALGRSESEITTVWELVSGFQGYAFCRAHSTAYGVEAYQGAYLKRYHAPEFLAAVLTNGKGFYSPLAYTLECRRMGIRFRLPCVNASRTGYQVEYDGAQAFIRLPLAAGKDLTATMLARYHAQRGRAPFLSLADFVQRVSPSPAEMLTLIRAGVFDAFGDPRPRQFWQARSWDTGRPARNPCSPPPLTWTACRRHLHSLTSSPLYAMNRSFSVSRCQGIRSTSMPVSHGKLNARFPASRNFPASGLSCADSSSKSASTGRAPGRP